MIVATKMGQTLFVLAVTLIAFLVIRVADAINDTLGVVATGALVATLAGRVWLLEHALANVRVGVADLRATIDQMRRPS